LEIIEADRYKLQSDIPTTEGKGKALTSKFEVVSGEG
jgi:hypothetical protein